MVDRFQRNKGEDLAGARFPFSNSSRPLKDVAEQTPGRVQQAVRNWWESLHTVEVEAIPVTSASEDLAAATRI